MDLRTIADMRLISQRLNGAKAQTPKELVAYMGAMQSQDFGASKWGVGIRARRTDNEVEAAFNRGDILRTHILRPTWHLVTPENIRWMTALSADKIKASARTRDKFLEITERLYAQTNKIIYAALSGGRQLTREDLGKKIERSGIVVNSARMVHFMLRAEADGVVCSGALRGRGHTYALLDERVPKTRKLTKDEALGNLARIYFNSRSPATLSDFVWWSGLSKSDAAKGLDAVRSELATEVINETFYVAAAQNTMAASNIAAAQNTVSRRQSAHLLPAFDEFIIAYANREAVLAAEHFDKLISSNGIFKAALIVNGRAVGRWASDKSGVVLFDFFETPSADVRFAAEKAAAEYGAFKAIK
jgi:hypothetical protein